MSEVLNMQELEKLIQCKRVLAAAVPDPGQTVCINGKWFRSDENGAWQPIEKPE